MSRIASPTTEGGVGLASEAANVALSRLRKGRGRWRLCEDWGRDDAGLDDRDAHIEGPQFLRKRLAHGFKRPFRRRIAAVARPGDAARDRGDVDDRSPTTFAHAWDDDFGAPERPEEIRLHHLSKPIDRRLFDNAAAGDSSVIDEDVDRPMLGDNLGEGLADGGVVIDVERSQMDWKLLRRGYFANLRAAIQVAHRRDNGVPGACQRNRGRKADTAARSRDQSQRHVASPHSVAA